MLIKHVQPVWFLKAILRNVAKENRFSSVFGFKVRVQRFGVVDDLSALDMGQLPAQLTLKQAPQRSFQSTSMPWCDSRDQSLVAGVVLEHTARIEDIHRPQTIVVGE